MLSAEAPLRRDVARTRATGGQSRRLPLTGAREPGAVAVRAPAAIFAGGFVGAVARGAVTELSPVAPGSWPWTTLAVNLLGAFLLGYFVTRLQERLPTSRYRRSGLGTGLCGALTTFSTLQLELLRMLDAGRLALAMAYAVVSVAGGLLAMILATHLVRRVGLGR